MMKEQIAKRNDEFRQGIPHNNNPVGTVRMTPGIEFMDHVDYLLTLRAVKDFNEFEEGDDPYGEHDFGMVMVNGNKVFWKIDYYDSDKCEFGTEDKLKAYLVLTIMLAEEY